MSICESKYLLTFDNKDTRVTSKKIAFESLFLTLDMYFGDETPILICGKMLTLVSFSASKVCSCRKQRSVYAKLLYFLKLLNFPTIYRSHTAQKMKFSIKDFFSKFDQIRCFLWISSHLLKKLLMGNFIFCAISF